MASRWNFIQGITDFFFGKGSSSSDSSSEDSSGSTEGQAADSKTSDPFNMDFSSDQKSLFSGSFGVNDSEMGELSEYFGLSGIFKGDKKDIQTKYLTYGPYANIYQEGDEKSKIDTASDNKLSGSKQDTEGFFNAIKNSDTAQIAFGMPLKYGSNADPCDRVYASTLVKDLPIVYLIPGKAKINTSLIDNSGGYINLDKYYENLENGEIPEFKIKKTFFGDDKNMKYMHFKSNYNEFWKYVQLSTSAVYSYFKLAEAKSDGKADFELFNFDEIMKNRNWNAYGVPFYYDRSSTFSEDISNSYSSSRIAEAVNEKSSETREIAILGDKNGFTNIFTSVGENIKALIQGLSDSMKATASYDYILTKTANKLVRVVNGSLLDFPEVFNDSKFDKNYNFTFKFFSPYGDDKSIFKYVIVPYLTLLTFAMCRQDNPLSYVEPFYVRVEAPGKCSIDMGVITALSITKGGSENLWTVNGLPRCIEVTASIMDLYPTMNMVRTTGMLRYNSNFSAYLENLAGIRTDSMTTLGSEFKWWINRKLSNNTVINLPNKVKNFVSDKLYDTQKSISDIFR